MDSKPDFSNIPPVNELIPILDELENREWKKYEKGKDIEEYINELDSLLAPYLGGGIHLFFQNYESASDWHIPFFRIRNLVEIKNKYLRTEFSYPPPSILSHQRANLPGFPVFYAASNPFVALQEVIKDKPNKDVLGGKYCLSAWQIKGKEDFIFSKLMYDGVPKESPLHDLSVYDESLEPKEMKEWFTEEQRMSLVEIMKFYSRIFQNDSKYAISSFVSHRHLYNTKPNGFRSDIVIYPSIQSNKSSLNFAIHPNFVDERMFLKSIYELTVFDFTNSNRGHEVPIFTIEQFAVNDKGRIIWLDTHLNESLFYKHYSEDIGDTFKAVSLIPKSKSS
jgi:hypothetical protein